MRRKFSDFELMSTETHRCFDLFVRRQSSVIRWGRFGLAFAFRRVIRRSYFRGIARLGAPTSRHLHTDLTATAKLLLGQPTSRPGGARLVRRTDQSTHHSDGRHKGR